MTDTAKRYYYDCRIKAAYMVEYFEMHLFPDCWTERSLGNTRSILGFHHHLFGGKFYVHERSFDLLEPREGDILYGPCGGEVFRVSDLDVFHQEASTRFAKSSIHNAGWRLIQRDGKAFHWPEVEA